MNRTREQRECRRLYALARANGWVQPSEMDRHGPAAWVRYWSAMEENARIKARDPEARPGRPIPPHTVGQPPVLDMYERAIRINESRALWEGFE